MADEARPVAVLVVDDHRLVAEALTSLLSEHPEVRVVGTAGSVGEAVTVGAEARPDVVLMDFRLPDGDGTVAARQIRAEHPEVAVLFLSAEHGDEAMLKAVEAGACGYISKDTGPDELVAAIRRAADGEFLLPAATMSRLLSRQREVRQQELEQQRLLDELTPREQQILSLLATGANNRAIAAQLGIAYGTVRTHVRSLLEKLESSSRLQAVSTARERRLLD
ncbi:MAG TPA: response regulator transcription factor [Candidatus Dormibacteraeota bacterium]